MSKKTTFIVGTSFLSDKIFAGKAKIENNVGKWIGTKYDVTQSFIDTMIKYIGENCERTIISGNDKWVFTCHKLVYKKKGHTISGNCSVNEYKCTICGIGELCDVCHDHDEPRGKCSECKRCKTCDKQTSAQY